MKNFPHQYNDFRRIREALQTILETSGAGQQVTDDGVLGYALARRGVYKFRNLAEPLEDRIAREQAKPRGSQGARTAARETRRTLTLLGFLGDGGVTDFGRALLESDVGGDNERGTWQRALLSLELTDSGGNTSHPVRILLRLVRDQATLLREDMALALEARDDSEAEYSRVQSLLALDRASRWAQLGVSEFAAANAVKILPAFAEQAGLMARTAHNGQYHLTEAGRAALDAGYTAMPLSGVVDRIPAVTSHAPAARRGAVRPVRPGSLSRMSNIDPATWATLSASEQLTATRLRFERSARHQALVEAVASLVGDGDGELLEDLTSYDLLRVARDPQMPLVLFEMKTLDADASSQVRLAVGQLLSYEFLVVRRTYPDREVVKAVVTDGPVGSDLRDFLDWAQIASFEWDGRRMVATNSRADGLFRSGVLGADAASR